MCKLCNDVKCFDNKPNSNHVILRENWCDRMFIVFCQNWNWYLWTSCNELICPFIIFFDDWEDTSVLKIHFAYLVFLRRRKMSYFIKQHDVVKTWLMWKCKNNKHTQIKPIWVTLRMKKGRPMKLTLLIASASITTANTKIIYKFCPRPHIMFGKQFEFRYSNWYPYCIIYMYICWMLGWCRQLLTFVQKYMNVMRF